MRGLVAALLLAATGTGCCKTCGSCRSDAAPVRSGSGYATAPATDTVNPPAAPPAPAVRSTGAYGGTGN